MSVKFLDKLFGRTGNRLFQMAALYQFAQRHNGGDIYFQNANLVDPGFIVLIQRALNLGNLVINRVAIHVRRGKNPSDPREPAYFENHFYVNLMETDYYQKAMAQFPDWKFLVFSDDIPWCRKQKIFKGCEFSTNKDEQKDLFDMASCANQIIANSSFSLWAGILNTNLSKQVMAPKAWYTDGVERTKVPESWVQI